MLGRVREYFTLRGAIDEAGRPDRKVSAEAVQLLAWGRQQAGAAEVLWANGHSAEALRLAHASLTTTLEAVSAAGDEDAEGWRDLLDDALAQSIDHALRDRPLPKLDADMESEDADRYREIQRARRQADRTIRYAVRTERELVSVRRRRMMLALLMFAGLAVGVGFFVREQIRVSNAVWVGRYYPQRNFQGQPIERNDPNLDFDWQAESPMSGIPEDNWTGRWDTCIRVTEPQQILISVGSDDGSRVLVDGRREVDNWRSQTERWEHGRVDLEPGVHHIRVEYFEAGGRARIRARISSDAPVDLFRPDDPDARCGREAPAAMQEPAKTPMRATMRPTPIPMSPMIAPTVGMPTLPVQPNTAAMAPAQMAPENPTEAR